ncbi:MAG: cyclopropane fatty acyl phospholipid synthase [Chloroflexi bacterium]|nr:cyclopropane fatty acyl phospholipid synthase [Chloroflexota bacterium]
MTWTRFRRRLEALLAIADVRIDGDRPWDIQVHDEALFPRMFSDGPMGFGEGYMDGWWDCEQLDEMTCRVCQAELYRHFRPLSDLMYLVSARLIRLGRGTRGDGVGDRHYELGADLFRAMLGERMMYSSAYWKDAETLDQAQDRKLDLIARKLQLEPGMKVLDIGCGWGGAIHYFAGKYGVSGVGVTPSRDQYDAARDLCSGLPVEIRRQDYREVDEQFDRIYSIDMIGHVGRRHYRTYMEHVRRCLAPGGLSLVQTIGTSSRHMKTDPWVRRYIFPDSDIPSARQLMAASQDVLVMDDWHSFPEDYDRTFMCWYENLSAAWEDFSERHDERFLRMWRYFLLCAAGCFRSRVNQVWQIVLSAPGMRHSRSPADIR